MILKLTNSISEGQKSRSSLAGWLRVFHEAAVKLSVGTSVSADLSGAGAVLLSSPWGYPRKIPFLAVQTSPQRAHDNGFLQRKRCKREVITA